MTTCPDCGEEHHCAKRSEPATRHVTAETVRDYLDMGGKVRAFVVKPINKDFTEFSIHDDPSFLIETSQVAEVRDMLIEALKKP